MVERWKRGISHLSSSCPVYRYPANWMHPPGSHSLPLLRASENTGSWFRKDFSSPVRWILRLGFPFFNKSDKRDLKPSQFFILKNRIKSFCFYCSVLVNSSAHPQHSLTIIKDISFLYVHFPSLYWKFWLLMLFEKLLNYQLVLNSTGSTEQEIKLC